MSDNRVLIVDDDEDIRRVLNLFLKNSEYDVVGEAPDGMNILEIIEQKSPNIVLLDINMPGINGLDVLSKINQSYPDIKVVIVTVSGKNIDINKAKEQGACGYVYKPFDTNTLIQDIRLATNTNNFLQQTG